MGINATAVWRARPSGNNANGGGFDSGISSPGTDYSQQNAAQVTFNGTTVLFTTSGVTNIITLSGYTASAADIGNCLHITGGGNFTTGWYFITNQTSSTWTLDHNCCTGAGTAGAGRMGGGWADPRTNSTVVVAGNIIYALGAGIPNYTNLPGTADYTLTSFVTPTGGDSTSGFVKFATDPATPNYSTGGRAIIKGDGLCFYNQSCLYFERLVCTVNGSSNGNLGFFGSISNGIAKECVFDQNGYDCCIGSGATSYIDCEVTSSVAKRSTNANAGIVTGQYGQRVFGCNIHDCIGPGVAMGNICAPIILFSVISRNGGDGIALSSSSASFAMTVASNTIDNNLGHGISIALQVDLQNCAILNNIIANHTAGSKYGITVAAGAAAANDRIKSFVDFNTYYNNTNNVNAISQGANDTTGGADPFSAESTNNFTLTSTYKGVGTTPAALISPKVLGWNSSSNSGSPQSYLSPGAVQPNPSGTIIITNVTRNIYMTEDQADGPQI